MHMNFPDDLQKIELHCHMQGILGPEILRTVRAEGHVVLVDPEQLVTLLPIRDLQGFQDWLKMTRPYQQQALNHWLPVLERFIPRLIRQKVIYAEWMISPTLFPASIDALVTTLAAFREWLTRQEGGQIQIELLLSIPRSISDEALRREMPAYLELWRLGLIAGIALVGIEDDSSFQRFAGPFRILKDAGLGIEIHAGEHSGPEPVREVLQYGLADRIGHGIGIFRDPSLVERVFKEKVHLEFCLTSNLRTGSVPRLEQHPIRIAMEQSLHFSLNTDDPGLFECDLNGEYRLAATLWGFAESEFHRIYRNALEARFQQKWRYPSLQSSTTPEWG